jgi:hypothetical protein
MALTITGWFFDQPVYNTGDTINLTVNYTSTDFTDGSDPVSSGITVTVTDTSDSADQASDGSSSFPDFTVAGTAAVVEPTTVAVSDNRSPAGTWTEVSNTLSGTVSPFTGVAIFTSVA